MRTHTSFIRMNGILSSASCIMIAACLLYSVSAQAQSAAGVAGQPTKPAVSILDPIPKKPEAAKTVVEKAKDVQPQPSTVSTPLQPTPADMATKPEDPLALSLSSIILFALSDNPDIGVAEAREKQAKSMTGRANARLLPLVDGVAEGTLEFNDPAAGTLTPRVGGTNPSSRIGISLRQLVYDFGQARSNLDQFKQLEQSSQIQTRLSEEGILNDTIRYYLQMLNFQNSLKDTDSFVLRMHDLVKIINDMYDAGGTSKATLDYARSRLAFAETQLNSIRSSMNDAVSNLEFLTGKLPEFSAIKPDDLDPARLDLTYYKDIAEQKNLGVLLNNSDLVALDHKRDAAEKTFLPNINFLVNTEEKQNDGGEIGRVRNVEAMLQMNYRFYDGGDRKEQVNMAKAQIEELQMTRRKTLNELSRQVKLAYNQIILLNESIKQTQQEISASEAFQNLNRENFKLGSINIIELVEGEERLNAARIKIYGLQSDLYTNTYRLLITAGLLKKDFFCATCNS